MILYPAMDLIGGRIVRLRQGRFDEVTTYEATPAEALRGFAAEGATWAHVVDLDGARAGSPAQHELLTELAAVAPLKLQVAGGVRTADHVATLLDAGEAHYKAHGKPLFSSHMLDLSEEPLHENIEICQRYLARMSKMGMTLEIELGVTGGEEDGVDNSGVDSAKLYTQPEDVALAYQALSRVSDRFTIAAAFGNVHGVYKPGNVKLQPIILKNSQDHVQKKFGTGKHPIDFVFHGGSGSTLEEIREAISYGVIKMNIDTDLQWAFWDGVRGFYKGNEGYLQGQIGNPEGDEKPNKKYYDPRAWLRKGEDAFRARLKQAFVDLNNVGTLA